MPTALPNSMDYLDRRRLEAAEGYLVLDMPGEAEAELDSLSEAARRLPAGLAMRLMLHQQRKQWAPMRDIACHLTSVHPEDAQWWISWAYAARRTESLTSALGILERARALHGAEAFIHFNLACYFAQLRRLPAARAALRQAIRLNAACRQMAREEPDLAPLRAVR